MEVLGDAWNNLCGPRNAFLKLQKPFAIHLGMGLTYTNGWTPDPHACLQMVNKANKMFKLGVQLFFSGLYT